MRVAASCCKTATTLQFEVMCATIAQDYHMAWQSTNKRGGTLPSVVQQSTAPLEVNNLQKIRDTVSK